MIVLSATQSLAPAIERTRRLLFHPFRFVTFLKLCAVAVFTEGFGSNFNFGGTSHSTSHHAGNSPSVAPNFSGFNLTQLSIAAIVAALALLLVISILLFYVITRLRFALFYCLTYQVKEIRPGWQLYREPANRFFKLNLAVALAFLLLVALIVAPFALGFFRMFKSNQAGAPFDLALFLYLFLPLVLLILAIALCGLAVDIVLRDFMLPYFALEDLPAAAAWAEVRTQIRAEKGTFFLYAVLRILLPIAAMIALVIVLAIPILIVFGLCAGLIAVVHILTQNGPLALSIVGGVLEFALGLAILVLALLFAVCFGGPLSIWVRSFALTFYGGRYKMLGDVLFPPPPPSVDAGPVPSV